MSNDTYVEVMTALSALAAGMEKTVSGQLECVAAIGDLAQVASHTPLNEKMIGQLIEWQQTLVTQVTDMQQTLVGLRKTMDALTPEDLING